MLGCLLPTWTVLGRSILVLGSLLSWWTVVGRSFPLWTLLGLPFVICGGICLCKDSYFHRVLFCTMSLLVCGPLCLVCDQ